MPIRANTNCWQTCYLEWQQKDFSTVFTQSYCWPKTNRECLHLCQLWVLHVKERLIKEGHHLCNLQFNGFKSSDHWYLYLLNLFSLGWFATSQMMSDSCVAFIKMSPVLITSFINKSSQTLSSTFALVFKSHERTLDSLLNQSAV